MAVEKRRGVTRSYVYALIAACVFLALSFLVAVWGLTSVLLLRFPVETSISRFIGPGIIALTLALLAWSMWQQSLDLLRGNTAVPAVRLVTTAVTVYLVWSLLGMLAGMAVTETWLSVYAFELAVIYALAQLTCWWLLLRRVYTDRPTPQWPWEKDEHEREIQELNDIWHASSDDGDDSQPPRERL